MVAAVRPALHSGPFWRAVRDGEVWGGDIRRISPDRPAFPPTRLAHPASRRLSPAGPVAAPLSAGRGTHGELHLGKMRVAGRGGVSAFGGGRYASKATPAMPNTVNPEMRRGASP